MGDVGLVGAVDGKEHDPADISKAAQCGSRVTTVTVAWAQPATDDTWVFDL